MQICVKTLSIVYRLKMIHHLYLVPPHQRKTLSAVYKLKMIHNDPLYLVPPHPREGTYKVSSVQDTVHGVLHGSMDSQVTGVFLALACMGQFTQNIINPIICLSRSKTLPVPMIYYLIPNKDLLSFTSFNIS